MAKEIIPKIEGEAVLAHPLRERKPQKLTPWAKPSHQGPQESKKPADPKTQVVGNIGWLKRPNSQERAELEARLAFHKWTPWRDVATLFPGTPLLKADAGTSCFYSTIMRRCRACGQEELRTIDTPWAELKKCEVSST